MRRAIGATLLAGFGLVASGGAQARPAMSIAADSTGALTAIRAVDLRQICRCPTVVVDSIVRRGSRARMFEILNQPAARTLTVAEVTSLKLARAKLVRAGLRSITTKARDTAFVASQLLPAAQGETRVLVVVGPPNGVVTAYLIGMVRVRNAWRVIRHESVLE